MPGTIQKIISRQVWRLNTFNPSTRGRSRPITCQSEVILVYREFQASQGYKMRSHLKKRAKEIISTSLYLNVKERRQLERNHTVQSPKQAESQLKRSLCYLWSHDWGNKH